MKGFNLSGWALNNRSVVAYLMIVAVLFVGINFTVDIVYTLIDPRIDVR